ncbi:hypothetical protein FCE95_11750 [Luteimonas gilva]|uniref:DUF2147 domain-containing protein n=1 Tax=Luteimonas gilva TaxID=2572684 RepID=A0A4U5JPL2_9GAMM|nr:DUF6289 family protein [Luteimonas gilva]TKR30766.1 hypothetical protein FCE95_11750 [Luteimonas gilva]
MSRNRIIAATVAAVLFACLSFSAAANWQGTWHYYDDEGALVGAWTAGCGAMDGRWGIETENKWFTQGCRPDS